MDEHLKGFQDTLAGLFREYILGIASQQIGMQYMAIAPDMSVSIKLSGDTQSEPIFASELATKQRAVRGGISELFQSKSVAIWADLLYEIYTYFVVRHVKGIQLYEGLISQKITYDFKSDKSLEDQISESLIRDFSFQEYKKKYAQISRLLGLEGMAAQAKIILKHVELRNAFQHHAGRLHADALKSLGVAAIELQDDKGSEYTIKAGDSIYISSIEVDVLKSALFQISSYIGGWFEKN